MASSDEPPAVENSLPQHAAARVGYSATAAEISDYTAALVPNSEDHLHVPGAFITQARRVRTLSMALLVRAVLLERSLGHSWKQIAHAHGYDEEWVVAQYGPVEQEWLQALNHGAASEYETVEMAGLIKDVPESLEEINALAEELNAWCERRRDADADPRSFRLVGDGMTG
jgi:hypothetical protein